MSKKAFFCEYNHGTEFMAQQVWRNEDTGLIEGCASLRAWDQVTGVLSAVEPSQFSELEGPLCIIIWDGGNLHIRADFRVVTQAYLRYKQRYGGQPIRLLAN